MDHGENRQWDYMSETKQLRNRLERDQNEIMQGYIDISGI